MLRLCCLHRFSIKLDGLDLTYTHVALVRNAQGSADLQNTGLDGYTYHNGILHVEDGALDHLKKTGEHSLATLVRFSLVSALLDVCFELVEEVIDNVSCEYCDAIIICVLLCLGHYSNVKG